MKKRIITGLLMAFTVVVCFAAAIDISGKWTGTLKTDDGNEFPLTYNFKVTGNKVEGSIETSAGDLPMSNGKMKGDSISFTVNYNGADVPNSGRCYTDSIALNTALGDAVYHIVLKRAK